jgi:hypothetical protein
MVRSAAMRRGRRVDVRMGPIIDRYITKRMNYILPGVGVEIRIYGTGR